MQKSKKRLEWSASALVELEKGIAYYAERNPVAAQRMLEEIDHAAQSLITATVPAQGKPGCVPGTRELVLGSHTPYILIFREVANEVTTIQILRVTHTSRKYP